MKYVILMFVMFFTVSLTAQTIDEAIEWNDDIVMAQTLLLAYEDDLIEAIADDKSVDSIAFAYVNYCSYINAGIEHYKNEPAFDSKDIFRKAVIVLFEEFKEVAVNQYMEVLYIYFKPAEELSDSDYDRWDKVIGEVDDLEGKSNEAFLEAQEKFSTQYGFSLGE